MTEETEPVVATEAASAAIIERIEGEILTMARNIALFAGLPFFVLIAVVTLSRGTLTPGFAGWLCGVTGLVASVGLPGLSHRVRTRALVAALTFHSLAALSHYGPNVGTGLIFAMAVLTGAYFHGRPGAAISIGALALGLVGAAIASTAGWLQLESAPPTGLAWARLVFSSTVSLLACSLVFLAIQRAFRRSVAAELAANAAQRQAAAERERLLQSALASQRLEALGRLAGGVAHDFNNALVVVRGGVDLLRGDCPEPERGEILDDIEAGVGRASATARQLLSFARQRPTQSASGRADPAELLGRLASTLGRVMPENVRIALDVRPASPVALEPPELEQALLNLVLNARDALPVGGTITLGCRDELALGEVELWVADDGTGMTPQVQARVLEPFFSTKGEHGTGLGLSMVARSIQAAGGRLELESEVGRGTTVRLRLPKVAPPDPSAAPSSPAAQLRLQGRLLVVEDEALVRAVLRRILTRAGASVELASSLAEARSMLAQGHFDLLLTDGVLGDGGAREVVRAFRASYPNGPVLVCSGHLPNEEEFAALGSACRLVGKPFAPEELLGAIRALLAGEATTRGA